MDSARIEALLACGYAIFLTFVAAALEFVARYSHRRTQALPTVGFTYHGHLDLWVCPTGQSLHRADVDVQRRVVRYRAQAHHCNACAIKHQCTDSDEGRVLEHHPDSWLQSGLRQFHRGLSLTLLLLAFVVIVLELLRQSGRPEQIGLATLAMCIGGSGMRLLHTVRSPHPKRP
jgi:Transposase DDE domain